MLDRIIEATINHKKGFFIVSVLIVSGLVLISINSRESIPGNCREVETNDGTIIECETEEEAANNQFSDIMDSLPIRRYNYEINFVAPGSTSSTMPILITVLPREFPVPSPNTEPNSRQYVQFVNYVREHRSAAISEFKSLDLEEDRYALYFAENYAIEEFDGDFIENL